MKFNKKAQKEPSMAINITPLIDVVFILLIFFAVTTSFISASAIDVDLPNAKGDTVNQEQRNIRVSINTAGTIFIDGEQVAESKLSERFIDIQSRIPDSVIVIEADEKSMYGKVVLVIDKARGANLTKFAIATEEEK